VAKLEVHARSPPGTSKFLAVAALVPARGWAWIWLAVFAYRAGSLKQGGFGQRREECRQRNLTWDADRSSCCRTDDADARRFPLRISSRAHILIAADRARSRLATTA